MFKVLSSVVLLCVGLLLGGCPAGIPALGIPAVSLPGSTGTGVTGGTTATAKTKIATAVATVQSITSGLCKIEPLTSTVLSLFNVMAGSTVHEIASAVCNAVVFNPQTEGPGGGRTVPKVNGVVIQYKKV